MYEGVKIFFVLKDNFIVYYIQNPQSLIILYMKFFGSFALGPIYDPLGYKF